MSFCSVSSHRVRRGSVDEPTSLGAREPSWFCISSGSGCKGRKQVSWQEISKELAETLPKLDQPWYTSLSVLIKLYSLAEQSFQVCIQVSIQATSTTRQIQLRWGPLISLWHFLFILSHPSKSSICLFDLSAH